MEKTDNKQAIKIKINQNDKIAIIEVDGDLIYQNVAEAKEQLKGLDETKDGYIMDFCKAGKVDSTGFGLVLGVIKKIPKDQRLKVVINDEFLDELFRITKLDKLVDIVSSLEGAKASFITGDGLC